MVLIFAPVINDVRNIKIIGIKLINIRNINFLSFIFSLNFIFLVSNQIKKKKGTSIPICFDKNNNGLRMWSKIPEPSNPVRFNPYVIVIKSLLKSQIKWGTNKTKKTSIVIKYLKSNFLVFLKKIIKIKNKKMDINK